MQFEKFAPFGVSFHDLFSDLRFVLPKRHLVLVLYEETQRDFSPSLSSVGKLIPAAPSEILASLSKCKYPSACI